MKSTYKLLALVFGGVAMAAPHMLNNPPASSNIARQTPWPQVPNTNASSTMTQQLKPRKEYPIVCGGFKRNGLPGRTLCYNCMDDIGYTKATSQLLDSAECPSMPEWINTGFMLEHYGVDFYDEEWLESQNIASMYWKKIGVEYDRNQRLGWPTDDDNPLSYDYN